MSQIQKIQGTTQSSPIKKAAKVAAGTALAAGAVAAGLIAGNKTDAFVKLGSKVGDKAGKLKPVLDKTLAKLNKAGEFLSKKADGATTKFAESGLKEKITSVPGKIHKAVSNLADKVESKFSAAKFNPDAATAADKAAETFNNFVK